MIKLEKTSICGWEEAIRGMRNPMNSWDRSDSEWNYAFEATYVIGENDAALMRRLCKGGPVHAKFRRMITVYVDITAPFYWWKEMDTYKVGTVANSCSTMHKLTSKPFEMSDFSVEHLDIRNYTLFSQVILNALNDARSNYVTLGDKADWWQLIQLLPTSYNQKRTMMLNYEVLVGIYRDRKNHKLDEWHTFCDWIETLPYSWIITGEEK